MAKRWQIFSLERVKTLFQKQRQLPPGEMDQLYRIERSNRMYLLEMARLHGPIFKSSFGDLLHISIIGISRCRRFLKENNRRLLPYTIQVEHMVPKGFMRQMEGDVHTHYRRVLLDSLRETAAAEMDNDMEQFVSDGLYEYRENLAVSGAYGPQVFLNSLNAIATRILIRMFFGARRGTRQIEELQAGFQALGPQGVVWNPEERQESAFKALTEMIRAQLLQHHKDGDGLAPCTHAKDLLDETMLGNMIYMVEMGRYDIKALFRWLSKYGSEHPAMMEAIATEGNPSSATRSLAEAFVLETLRTDQSERLMRLATDDIVFDGYLIPKSAMIRLCMWESHHSEKAFKNPFTFKPERFLAGADPGSDIFSPFGLGHHRCPFSQSTIEMGTAFIRTLAREFTLTAKGNDKPVRGAYHWEPSPNFYVEIVPKRIELHATT